MAATIGFIMYLNGHDSKVDIFSQDDRHYFLNILLEIENAPIIALETNDRETKIIFLKMPA